MRAVGSVRLSLIALTIAAAASAAIAHTYRTLLSSSGLSSATWTGIGFSGSPIDRGRDVLLSSATAHAKALVAGGPSSTEWRGYLFVPTTDRYRVVVIADDRASIDLDHRRLAAAAAHPGVALVDLNRGLHPLVLRYEDEGSRQALEVLWARGNGVPARIEPLWLVPDLRPYDEIRIRRIAAGTMVAVAVFWSTVLLVAAAIGIRTLVVRVSPGPRSLLSPVLLVAAITFACGLWWGLPDFYGWAPDELLPGHINDALARRFSGGWATIYPPLHYAVLALFTAPFHLLAAIGLLDPEHLHVNTAMFVVQRLVTLVLSLGTLGLVAAIGSTVSSRTGALAAAIAAVSLPFAYYAKTANVDIPYVFWFSLSMVFYVRMHRTGATADFLLFVLAGVAAIATKDQAYGFYVLPAAAIITSALRRWRGHRSSGAPSLGVLAMMAALAIGGLIFFDNLLFNFSGFVEHLRIITGPASKDFRMYEPTVHGQLRMLRDAVWQCGSAMSWPLFLTSVIAAVTAWRARVTTVRLLLLPLLSYYLTVIAVVGYHYDRFFIGPVIILAIGGGWWLDRWLNASGTARVIRTAVVSCALLYALSRAAALDALMMFDSRYAVEQWVLDRVPADAHLAGAGQYLPRGGRLFWSPMAQDPEALARERPDVVIVNAAYMQRWTPDSTPGRFYQSLSRGSTYHLLLRYRTRVWWSPLQFEKRFSEPVDDPFSNLAKVNPLIEVYGR